MSQIKYQGEVYDTPDEALSAAAALEARVDELPETSPVRETIAAHVAGLRTAAGAEAEPSSAPGPGEAEPEPEPHPEPALAPTEPQPEPEAEPQAEPSPEDEADDFVCPVCMGRGVLPFEPPHDPQKESCPRCHGHGKVLTGSRVEGHMIGDCPDCQGQGWIQARTTFAPTITPTGASPSPGWPGATWDAEAENWQPPPGLPPWTGAEWDALRGTYQ